MQNAAATEKSADVPIEPQRLAEELESKCRDADRASPDFRGCAVPTHPIARPRQTSATQADMAFPTRRTPLWRDGIHARHY